MTDFRPDEGAGNADRDDEARSLPAISGGAQRTPSGDPIPAKVGPYTILRVLGEGGMGVVYLAEQRTPVRRTVALKVIKPGISSPSGIARFEHERQALAVMNHSHIAKMLEAFAVWSRRVR